MRYLLLLIFIFIHFSFIFSNATLKFPIVSDNRFFKSASVDHKMNSSEIPFTKSLRTTRNVEKEIGANGLSPTTPLNDEIVARLKDKHNQIHITKVKPEHFKRPYVNQLNKKSNSLKRWIPNLSNFWRLFNYKFQKRGLFYPYYLPVYHHNFYHRHFYPNYDIHNSARRFMNRRRNIDDSSAGSQIHHPRKMLPYVEQNTVHFPPSNVNLLHETLSDNNQNSTSETQTENVSRSNPELIRDVLNKTFSNPGNVSQFSQRLPKDDISNENSSISPESSTDLDHSYSTERALIFPKKTLLSLNSSNENETKAILSPIGGKNDSEHENLKSDLKMENLNLASNRVYYEKIPENLNVSWFVYLNCSQDSCQLTNNTNVEELMNQGWILHNCTSYGCTEMYPKTEYNQNFICVLLLVFTLCVLKILAFVLFFYYCRRIKLSKLKREDENSSDEEKMDSDIDKKKDAKIEALEQNKHQQVKQSERTAPKQLHEGANSHQEIEPISSLTPRVGRSSSKVWTPPFERISPCLVPIAHDRDILIPKKTALKKFTLNSDNLLRRKKRFRSSIPRLERHLKCNKKTGNEQKTKKIEGKGSLKHFKGAKLNSGKDGGVMLMNLDDDICTSNFHAPSNIEKAPKWEDMLKKECGSFISIDLKEEHSKK